jgi:hypothetical protein
MNHFISDVVANVLQDFSPAALVAVLLINLGAEIITRIRHPQHRGHLVKETLAFMAVMAVMTAWAFLALAIPVGIARARDLNLAPAWSFVIGLFLYLIIALPLGYVMLGFLLGAQGGNLLDRRDLVRSRTPIYVYASLFKIGVVLIALAFIAFPALAGILPGATADRAVLMRYTVVALLLADTVCYGWVLVEK